MGGAVPEWAKTRADNTAHKTPDGTRIQAESVSKPAGLIVSTLPEAWGIAESGLVEEGRVKDILYSMPPGADKMEDLTALEEKMRVPVLVMVDHPTQVQELAKAKKALGRKTWKAFVKINGGGERAGVRPESDELGDLLEAIKSAEGSVEIVGFYSHFGQSYASDGQKDAQTFFEGEVSCVSKAAAFARSKGHDGRWVLSVGATPTIHAASSLKSTPQVGGDTLEYHAGCYAVNDLQQLSTGVVPGRAAIRVLSSVVSSYPERKEALCDAGALSLSKDRGREPGFGKVSNKKGWRVGRVSQEHGILTHDEESERDEVQIGERIEIIPQHACLTCACQSWIYVVDDKDPETVADVWVPWKGW